MSMALLRGRLELTSWPCSKCETDLPESLRLGRVQVSCEGWSGPGDSYVLRGNTTGLIDVAVLISNSRIVFFGVPPSRGTERIEFLGLSPQASGLVVYL